MGVLNATGVSITKYAAASQRVTIDNTRTLFVWIFSLIWLNESWNTLQLIAFIILVSGTLIYNEIVVVPISFMNYGTKKQLDKNKKIEDEDQNKYEDKSIITNSLSTIDNDRNINP